MNPLIRRSLLVMMAFAVTAAWAGVVVTYLTTESVAAFTIALTIAAIATEVLVWLLAIIGGWSLFANRKRLWNRFFGARRKEV